MPRLPALTARQLVRFLTAQGFVEVRQSGVHLTMRRESVGRTVPIHTEQDVGRGLLRRILHDAWFSTEDFFRLR